ncbi:ATP-dependent peptidase [Phakopsora pachyrhizi]|uniref:ATP-dependent peptidase n=1 Tax=Phakopsora pachyrhizi TaxID=170000 RepID=A0AAV0BDN2_PHAPC|nr:ATP-dependent peptidase [Phakopsora pachyrhizi]CAH7684990.1 ATP-dependent peptidase [Phakopsora pachyrhizi]
MTISGCCTRPQLLSLATRRRLASNNHSELTKASTSIRHFTRGNCYGLQLSKNLYFALDPARSTRPYTSLIVTTHSSSRSYATDPNSSDVQELSKASKDSDGSQKSIKGHEIFDTLALTKLAQSGTPQDLIKLKERIDCALNTSPTSLSQSQEESIKKLLNSALIWKAYLQAVISQSDGDRQSSIADLSESLRLKNESRQRFLNQRDSPGVNQSDVDKNLSSNSRQSDGALGRFLASYRLNPSSLVSAIFNRSGTRATLQSYRSSDLHAANQEAIAAGRTMSSPSTEGNTSPRSSFESSKDPEMAGTIKVIVEEYKGNPVLRALRFLGVTLVYSLIMLTLLSLVMDSSGLLKATSPTGGPTEFKPQGQKTFTFGDVHGCDEAKEELKEVVDFLKDPLRFARLGGRLPRGVLLTGPPGTGKTLLARAVAGEAGVQFFIASGSEFDEMYVGVGARRIRELFAAARKAAPAIIFIDELDAIGGKRSPKDQHYIKQTLNQLLVELDGFQQSEGVILMAATNFPSSLDKALTRPGRFDRHVAVPLPDARGRIQILRHHAKNVTVDPALDLSFVARSTPGFSGADLQNLVNQAAVKASREGALSVNAHHFDWARDRIMMGAENKSYITTPEQKRLTAYHEAGHALVSMYTPGATPLHKVTCLRRGHALGVTHFLPEMDKVSETYRECIARLDVGMGGRAAEEILMGKENVTSGASSDIDSVTLVATAMIREMGFSTKLGPRAYRTDDQLAPETLAMIDAEVTEMIEAAEKRALRLLLDKRDELDRLAQALVEYETLSAEEAWRVVKGLSIERTAV